MEWSKVAIDVLIEAYSRESCLYNNKSPSYHNKHARHVAMENVREALKEIRPSTTNGDIINKMKSLRTTFVAELNKVNNSKKSGAGMDEVYKPSIWYFEKLMFLKDYVQPRKGTSSAALSINKVNNSKKSGAGMDEVYKPSIWYFEKLMFLKDYVQPRKGTSSAALSRTHDASQGTANRVEFTCESVPTLDEVPVVGDWEVMTPVPSTSNDLPPQLIASPNQPSPHERSISRGQKRKLIVQEEDKLLQQATSVLDSVTKDKQQLSDLDAFGVFVSSALKQLKKKTLVFQGKREIFDVILNLQEEDHRLSE
ncbi:uncharacterized protein [Anabrus simplex]|uniref:uncharacterized protein n=1 Tax=Anabrus simplex TaxID=316456 RepID=UPI0035A29150